MFFKANQLTLLTILNVNYYILILHASQYFLVNTVLLFSHPPRITMITRILMH